MFKLRILSLFFLFAFAGSKAFKQTNQPNSNVKTYEDDKSGPFKDRHSEDINILLKDDGEVDLKLPNHAKHYHYFNEDENDDAPLLMKRGKHKGKGRGRYRGGGWSNKPWKNRNYGNYGGYGGGGPGGYNNDW